MHRPLASLLRPESLDDVFGQQHLLGKDKIFYKMLKNGTVPNMIFCGPSGVGKTTVANIIAKSCNMQLYTLNGTSASTADIKGVISQIDTLAGMNGILLYLDEIQYLNKKQQQSLLECIENGDVTLIAATTENPNFYIYSALLSRCSVFEFKQLEPEDVELAIDRALTLLRADGAKIELKDNAVRKLALAANGDVRKALTSLELIVAAAGDSPVIIDEDSVVQVTSHSAARYDRADDQHYNLLSALQKSVRGSDPDAALHYLARLLSAGDLISPCRRLLVMACEDIGLAYPQAALITKACVDAAREVGLPEAALPLSEAVVMLATAPKSNSASEGYWRALADVTAGSFGDVPDHLKGNPPRGAQPYLFPHIYKNHYVTQQYLPDAIKDKQYYKYGENKLEAAAKKYWDEIKGEKK